MRATTILAIVAIVAGAITSLIPVHQVSAQVVGGGGAQGPPIQSSNGLHKAVTSCSMHSGQCTNIPAPIAP